MTTALDTARVISEVDKLVLELSNGAVRNECEGGLSATPPRPNAAKNASTSAHVSTRDSFRDPEAQLVVTSAVSSNHCSADIDQSNETLVRNPPLPPSSSHAAAAAAYRSQGVMCCADVRNFGVQYGEGCGWGQRTAGSQTDEEGIVVPSRPAATDFDKKKSLLEVRSQDSQTDRMSSRAVTTSPIPLRHVTTNTTLTGEVVEYANTNAHLMRRLEEWCMTLEQDIRKKVFHSEKRITCVMEGIQTANAAVGHLQRQREEHLRTLERVSAENEALRAEVTLLKSSKLDVEQHSAMWRTLCEEAAREREEIGVENTRLHDHVGVLQQMIDRLERMMMMQQGRNGHHVVDEEDHDESTSSDSTTNDSHTVKSHDSYRRRTPLQSRPPRPSKAVKSSATVVPPLSFQSVSTPPPPVPPLLPRISPDARGVSNMQSVLDLLQQCDVALAADACDDF